MKDGPPVLLVLLMGWTVVDDGGGCFWCILFYSF